MHSVKTSVDFSSVRVSLTLFAGVSVLLMLITVITSVACIINFGNGLKNHTNPPKKRRKDSVTLELQESETPTRFLLH
jgi:amino acid transporter